MSIWVIAPVVEFVLLAGAACVWAFLQGRRSAAQWRRTVWAASAGHRAARDSGRSTRLRG